MSRDLSVVVLTFNEEAMLADCLESVAWADEIVIVDSFSNDGTLDIARRYTDRVFQKEFVDFGSQRNYGIDQCHGDWILMIDADERVTPELALEIQGILRSAPRHNGYWIPRRNIIFGKWLRHGGVYPDYNLRLWRRGKGRFLAQVVHERAQIQGKVGHLRHDLIHLSYTDIRSVVRKANRYSDLAVLQLKADQRRVRKIEILLRPSLFFLYNLLMRSAWLDGWRGVVYAGLSSLFIFLKYAKYLEETVWRSEP